MKVRVKIIKMTIQDADVVALDCESAKRYAANDSNLSNKSTITNQTEVEIIKIIE